MIQKYPLTSLKMWTQMHCERTWKIIPARVWRIARILGQNSVAVGAKRQEERWTLNEWVSDKVFASREASASKRNIVPHCTSTTPDANLIPNCSKATSCNLQGFLAICFGPVLLPLSLHFLSLPISSFSPHFLAIRSQNLHSLRQPAPKNPMVTEQRQH